MMYCKLGSPPILYSKLLFLGSHAGVPSFPDHKEMAGNQTNAGEEEMLPCRESENKAKDVSVHGFEQIHSNFLTSMLKLKRRT